MIFCFVQIWIKALYTVFVRRKGKYFAYNTCESFKPPKSQTHKLQIHKSHNIWVRKLQIRICGISANIAKLFMSAN